MQKTIEKENDYKELISQLNKNHLYKFVLKDKSFYFGFIDKIKFSYFTLRNDKDGNKTAILNYNDIKTYADFGLLDKNEEFEELEEEEIENGTATDKRK